MTKTAIKLFGYVEAQTITTRTYDGSHWYMGADICRLLGIKNHSVAIHGKRTDGYELIDSEWCKKSEHIGGYGKKHIIMVNDVGMIKLIMQGKTERALKVQDIVRNNGLSI